MIIDIHHHHIPTGFIELARTQGDKYQAVVFRDQPTGLEALAVGMTEPPPDRPLGRSLFALDPGMCDIAVHIQEMDAMEMDMAALSISPLLYYYWAEAQMAAEVCAYINDSIHETCQQHPDRFIAMGTVPLQDPGLAIAELERIVKNYGFTSIEIGASVNDTNLDDPALDPFFQRCEALDVLVFIHPLGNPSPNRLNQYYTENVIALPTETGIAVNSLIHSGVLARYPNIKFCCAHGGGIAPALIGRWDHVWSVREEPKVVISEPPSTYFRKFYWDDLVHSDKMLDSLFLIVGKDRVVVGTDYNYDMGQYPPKARLDRMALSAPERRAIEHETAARLLRREDLIQS